jgi:hypothetical protein
MTLGRRVGATVACAAIALLMLSTPSPAKPGYFFMPRETEARFAVRGSNGYRIGVVANRVGTRHRAKVVVSRGGAATTYRVPARVRPNSLRVNLGTLGRIDVRFHVRKRETEGNLGGCHGRPPVVETGSFKGLVRFRGENGYTRFSAARVRGERWNAFREVCKLSVGLRARPGRGGPTRSARPMPGAAGRAKDRDKSQLTELGAAWTGRSRAITVSYTSIKVPLKRGKVFSLAFAGAEVHERRGRMDIERSALVVPDNDALLLAPPAVDTQGATLTLPPPFAGSVSYESQPGATPTWSGSLRVHLPGAEPVPLTGKRFVVAFCQSSETKEVERCMGPVRAEMKRFDD